MKEKERERETPIRATAYRISSQTGKVSKFPLCLFPMPHLFHFHILHGNVIHEENLFFFYSSFSVVSILTFMEALTSCLRRFSMAVRPSSVCQT